MSYGKYIEPSRMALKHTRQNVERHIETINYTPSEAKPGDILSVHIPKLNKNMLIVPGTIRLVFDLELYGDDANTLVSNVAANLQAQVKDTIGGVELTNIMNYGMYRTYYSYKDLWLSQAKRDNMVMHGYKPAQRIGAAKKQDLIDAYGTKYCIPIDFEAYTHHAPIYAYDDVGVELCREIKFQDVNRVISTGTVADWDYKLKNIQMEYETIYSEDLARQIGGDLSLGKSFLYDHVTEFKTKSTGTDKLINLNLNFPRKSMKSVVLFLEKTFVNGTFDSEATSFQNPKITNVDCTFEGVSNKIFTRGFKQRHQWDEACRLFQSEETKSTADSYMDMSKFYNDNFALCLDMRFTQDTTLSGTGLNIQNTQNGIHLAITRSTDTVYTMHVFVVSDALFSVANNQFREFFV